MATFEVFFYCINEAIIVEIFKVCDIGGSVQLPAEEEEGVSNFSRIEWPICSQWTSGNLLSDPGLKPGFRSQLQITDRKPNHKSSLAQFRPRFSHACDLSHHDDGDVFHR